MNPVEILPAVARGAIVPREMRAPGRGADGAAEAFAALLEELSGGVAQAEAAAGTQAEGAAGDGPPSPAVEPDAAEVAEGAEGAVLLAAGPTEGQTEGDVDVPLASPGDANPAEPVTESPEGDAPVEPPEVARRGVASRVAEALWNAVFGIAAAAPEGEARKPGVGEGMAQVAPRAEVVEPPIPLHGGGVDQVAAPVRGEPVQMTGRCDGAEEAPETPVPPADRAVAEPSRPAQTVATPVATSPTEPAAPAGPSAPKTDTEAGVPERSDPAGRGTAPERVPSVAPAAPAAAAPVASAAVQAPALVEVAASQALEGWRLEAEPGGGRPLPRLPAQRVPCRLRSRSSRS
jgi:hypothetical protein